MTKGFTACILTAFMLLFLLACDSKETNEITRVDMQVPLVCRFILHSPYSGMHIYELNENGVLLSIRPKGEFSPYNPERYNSLYFSTIQSEDSAYDQIPSEAFADLLNKINALNWDVPPESRASDTWWVHLSFPASQKKVDFIYGYWEVHADIDKPFVNVIEMIIKHSSIPTLDYDGNVVAPYVYMNESKPAKESQAPR